MVIVSVYIGAVSSGLVFSKEYTNPDMESCNKEELMEVIRKEHLSVRNCHLNIGQSQPSLPIVIHNNGEPWTVNASSDGRQ